MEIGTVIEIIVVMGAGDVLLDTGIPQTVGTERGGIGHHPIGAILHVGQIVSLVIDDGLDDIRAVALRPNRAAHEQQRHRHQG